MKIGTKITESQLKFNFYITYEQLINISEVQNT